MYVFIIAGREEKKKEKNVDIRAKSARESV